MNFIIFSMDLGMFQKRKETACVLYVKPEVFQHTCWHLV